MKRTSSSTLICAVGAIIAGTAWSQNAPQQPAASEALEEIVITGSRTVTNGNDSPTPLTVISAEELAGTTPSDIPDALNKLPQFSASRNQVTSGNASANFTGNFLNLRGFGSIRTLILEDGRRVPSSAQDGTVDTNTLPQMLVQRVDIVTGGASAVYGSDAVTGAVNYVLDHDFNGVKVEAQGGESTYGDDGSWKFGIAAGKEYFGGALHLEGSFEAYNSAGVPSMLSRPTGAAVYCQAGSGTTASPFIFVPNCRYPFASNGGLIVSGPGFGLDFGNNGILTPFVHGASYGGINESGGNGTYAEGTSLVASLHTQQGFGRADLDFGNNVHGFVQAAWTRAYNQNNFVIFGEADPLTMSNTNPFLTPAQQALLGGPFTLAREFADEAPFAQEGSTTTVAATVGLAGQLTDKLNWNVYYTFGQTQLLETNIGNINTDKLAASLDAVTNPANGQVVCNVTLTNPGLYPGCIPVNPFGATADGPHGLDYARQNTQFLLTNRMNDVGGTISGPLFNDWAGPVLTALTGEFHTVSLNNATHQTPSQLQDCTGLRFNCSPTALLWYVNTTEPMHASENISEAALEATVPLLKDVTLAKSLELNGAVREAHYSLSGSATTWKIGSVWHVTDELTFRGTRSQDIRAPTLNDLDGALTTSVTGFVDSHTNTSGFPNAVSQGNPNLVPEKAQTWTAGFVFQPKWVPGFSVSFDYYSIAMNDAITTVGGNTPGIDQLCDQSGGTSPLCTLFVRPLPFSNTTPANFPTALLSQPLNVAQTAVKGFDVDANYHFKIESGRVDLRLLASHEPTLTITQPGTASINAAGTAAGFGGLFAPDWKLTFMGAYSQGPMTFNMETRWRSALNQNPVPAVYVPAQIASVIVTDMTLSYRPSFVGQNVTTFLSVQNVFNKIPPVSTGYPSVIANFSDPIVPGDDIIGRYFTAGIRMHF